ncbi:RNA-dependent RNA polymerase [Cronartium ribicola mitovirus 2]|uniref:RNA-dependent RNA polymerase n=1 Tax=Cronartium ribicola mitovirus 2 TaxID=1816485 RepID=A0A191KCN6_9VIRU|nr:RNA-dependent RNA polymerase [Cronartium ribicola mitovirus 2]AMQ67415.1 RNA-dependent RNA polymerase [Cronartium ribicola mitovirus 2]
MNIQAMMRWLAVHHSCSPELMNVVETVLIKWDLLVRTKGIKETVKYFKASRLHCTRYICGDPLLVSEGISISKDGLPNLIKGHGKSFFRNKKINEIRIILTILSMGRIIPGTGECDLTPISKPWLGQIPTSITRWINSRTDISKVEIEWKEPHWSTKAGPKGQAIASSIEDLASLPETLRTDIRTIGGEELSEYIDTLEPYYKNILPNPKRRSKLASSIRRLHIVLDKEYKTRPIAIIDYWSQTSLVPYHDYIMKWIQKQYGDYTLQSKVGKQIVKGQGRIYSFDLQNATDRFPLEFQKIVFAKFFGSKKADAWARIITQYPFELKDGSTVSYNCGQPIGAYSSWAIFTASHHLILQYIRFIHPETIYGVLGDDVVIRGDRGAFLYKEVMSCLDVKISESKTHVSNDTFEFAKRWFHKGAEITPFPLNEAIEAGTDVAKASQLFLNLPLRGWYLGGNDLSQSILEFMKSKIVPSNFASYLARRSARFIYFQKWAITGCYSYLSKLHPLVLVSGSSVCNHTERLRTAIMLGISKATAKEISQILEDINTLLKRKDIQGLVDQTTDSPSYTDLRPGEYALGKISLKLQKELRQFDVDIHMLSKMAAVPDWATHLGEASISKLKGIPVGRRPDPDTYISERRAVTATRSLLRVYNNFNTETQQFFAIRPAIHRPDANKSIGSHVRTAAQAIS